MLAAFTSETSKIRKHTPPGSKGSIHQKQPEHYAIPVKLSFDEGTAPKRGEGERKSKSDDLTSPFSQHWLMRMCLH